MPEVNITQAAKLADMTRQNLHKNYIKKGILTVDRSNPKKPVIEMSELLRVFPNIKRDVKSDVKSSRQTTEEIDFVVVTLNEKIRSLEAEVAMRERILHEKEERIADLKLTVALLTDKSQQMQPPPEAPKRRKFLGLF